MRAEIRREIARTEATIKTVEQMGETLRARLEKQAIAGATDMMAELFLARIVKVAYRETLLAELASELV